jgi:hypothetical protein
MSLAALLGLPGKTKTLLDRLTSARASKIDNLDTTVSSRAPASTAVSSANLTTSRIGNLDRLDTTISSRASATALSTLSADLTSVNSNVLSINDGVLIPVMTAYTSSGTYVGTADEQVLVAVIGAGGGGAAHRRNTGGLAVMDA